MGSPSTDPDNSRFERTESLSGVTTVERDRLLDEWNRTRHAYPSVAGVHELFESQAARTPNAEAVKFESRRCSYRELNERADRLARHLRGLGVGPDVLVPIFLERSVEMIVALLAVLKAGGAYVPLDPRVPTERVRFMLEETGARVILTETGMLSSLPIGEARPVCIDRVEVETPAGSDSNPTRGVGLHNLAYVIFTTGSTGPPKGVAVTHQGLLNYTAFIVDRLGLATAGRQYQFALVSTFASDLGNTCIFPCLVSGGCLHVLTHPTCTDSDRFAAYFSENSIDVLKIVPSHLLALLNADGPKAILPRHVLICGGEVFPRSLAERVARAADCAIFNHYGATETTVGSLMFEVPREGEEGERVPIGRPIANTRIYILDEQRRRVSVGVTGELYIGGAGVARGYLHRPELTADRFVPDPFLGEHGGKLYRTGDLVQYLPDGNVVFAGRIDNQVQIRGFRVEPAAIESVLAAHPHVQAGVVVAWTRTAGDRTLIAYVIPKGRKRLDPAKLRRFMKDRLPEYMIPATFVSIGTLPLSLNGKLNRAALSFPRDGSAMARESAEEPNDVVELRLLSMWRELFGSQQIGVEDDFFELGGHSLLAGRLFARIRRAFAQDLSPDALLRAPTIRSLARRLRDGKEPQRWTSLMPIQTEGTRPALFCMHAGAGTILFYYDLALELGHEQPVYGLQAQGLYGSAPPHATVEEMASHYLEEMRTVQPEGPYHLAGFCFGAVLAFELAQQLRRKGIEVGLLASFDGGRPGYDYHAISSRALPVFSSESLTRRIAFHWSNSRELGARYVLDKLSYRRDLTLERCVYALGRWCARHGDPLPGLLRRKFFYSNNRRAEIAYRPDPFPGSMAIFATRGRFPDPRLGWETLIQGGLEIYEVPGERRSHRDIMTSGFVADVARQLQKHLSRDVAMRERRHGREDRRATSWRAASNSSEREGRRSKPPRRASDETRGRAGMPGPVGATPAIDRRLEGSP